ncbi:MGH1-like glycoside hydrolase domain-containing protein [Kribbella sp. GL6]|uniref:MGH1-like glycoside hydrolase domain-containing protein n=1 Tax=Kribbella sp. GL6 TaxID=3419765 RepID=UPI003D062EDB
MPPYTLDDFSFDLRRGAPPDQIWVRGSTCTVNQLAGTVCGVAGWFAPPLAAPDSRLTITFDIDGHRVVDAARPGAGDRGLLPSGGTWYPNRLVRTGTYHQYTDGRLTSLAVESTLTPGPAGYDLSLKITNRTATAHEVTVHPDLAPTKTHHVPLADWGWVPPPAGEGHEISLDHSPLTTTLAPTSTTTFTLTVGRGGSPDGYLTDVLARLPVLTSDIPGLEQYYRRSLAGALVCWWDHPDFVTRPFIATSGLDGGALCAYAWDTGGYAPNLLSLMLGDSIIDIIESFLDADLTDSYAIAPDGTGLGVAYAYSGWSLVALARAASAHRQLDPTLVRRLYDAIAAQDQHFQPVGALRDYGDQSNLLEMRSSGWEHVVASPNAERAWTLDALAELSDLTRAALPSTLRADAQQIRDEVVHQLWDPQAGWFRSRYPDGHTELTYSIQAFDALDACPPEIAAAIVEHLRPGAFLGEYGVSSVSAEDHLHYETADIDWSGAGAYTGEAPQLALTLWRNGHPDRAWDVLKRLLWMGRHYPYFPQDHYSDKPGAPLTGRRINIIAGLTGAEAILHGMLGIDPHPDGSLTVNPVAPGNITLENLRFRDHRIDLTVTPDTHRITVDGRDLPPGTTLAVPAR